MRVLTQPDSIVRITIVNKNNDTRYINLIETTSKAVIKLAQAAIKKQKLSPFEKGYSTSIRVRESVKGVYGPNHTTSFKGLTVDQTYDILMTEITKISK